MKEALVEYPDHILLKAVQKLPNREDGKRQVAFQIAANLPERGKYTTAQVVAIWRRELRAVRDDPQIAQYWIGAVAYLAGPTAGGMEGSFMKIIRNYHAFYKEVVDKSGEQTIGELGDRSFLQVDGFDPDPEASTAEATLPASAITSYGRAL